MQSQRHQESNLGSDDERRKRNVSRSMQKESSQKPRAERLSAVKPQNLGFDPVRNPDAPPVAAPVAQSTNTTTPVPAVAVDNPYATLDPSENDVTPVSSTSDDDDFGSEDGTEDTAAQLIAKAMQTFDSHNSVIDGNAQISKDLGRANTSGSTRDRFQRRHRPPRTSTEGYSETLSELPDRQVAYW